MDSEEIEYAVKRIEAKQAEWEDNQRWQINRMQKTIEALASSVAMGLLVISVLLGYIAYKMS